MTIETNASSYWSAKKGYAPNWYSFCSDIINERITGDRALAPTIWALKMAGLPVKHALEIGCLSGDKLAGLVTAGLIEQGSGTDIAAGAIDAGKKRHAGIDLWVSDLNDPELPASTYSVILANGVLHHIANLEACAQALYDAVVPGGYLFASEFTGPCRYVYSSKEIRLIRDGQNLLPLELRGAPFDPAMFAPKLKADTSESVRTRDIEPILRATFDEVVVRPFGGNVLMRALTAAFFDNFDPLNANHTSAMERLTEFDREVSGREPSHNTYFVARKH